MKIIVNVPDVPHVPNTDLEVWITDLVNRSRFFEMLENILDHTKTRYY